jgi:hypothetical protein
MGNALERRLKALEEQATQLANQGLLVESTNSEILTWEETTEMLTNGLRASHLSLEGGRFAEWDKTRSTDWLALAQWANQVLDDQRAEGFVTTYVPLSLAEVDSALAHLEAGAFTEGVKYEWCHEYFPTTWHTRETCPDDDEHCHLGLWLRDALRVARILSGSPQPTSWEEFRPWLEQLRALYEPDYTDCAGIFVTVGVSPIGRLL